MRQLVGFDHKQHKALKQAVIKDQIHEKFVSIQVKSFLPGYEGKAVFLRG